MSKLKLDLDIDLVQATVKSQVEPAVKEALAKHDVKMLIVKALEAPTMEEGYPAYAYVMGMFGSGRDRKPEPLINGLVREAVHEAAKKYVAKAMRDNEALVQEAFAKMMRDSSSKLVKSFSKAITDGLASDWGFRFEANVKHTVPQIERDSYED